MSKTVILRGSALLLGVLGLGAVVYFVGPGELGESLERSAGEPVAKRSDPASRPFVRQSPEDFRFADSNLIVLSLTNLRADHLGFYGYSRDTSPNLDRLAERSLVLRNMFSHASWTLPVAMSLMTSQYPFTHGIMNRRSYEPLGRDVPTLVDVLNEAGYATAAFVGNRDYAEEFGHTSRFAECFDFVNEQRLREWKKYGVLENSVPEAISWLRKHKDEKFFLFVQGYDVHCPFAVPKKNDVFDPDYAGDIDFARCYWTFRRTKPIRVETESGDSQAAYLLKTKPRYGAEYEEMFFPEDVQHMVALYDGEILDADAQLGKLIDEVEQLGIDDETIIIFLSEHGDLFGKHGRFMRGGPLRGTFYDDVLRVPFLIHHPKLQPAQIDGLAELIDVAPTVLDLLGLEAPPTFRGVSLRDSLLENTPVRELVFAGSAYTPRQGNMFFHQSSIIVAARSLKWKLIHERMLATERSESESYLELFDLERDPDELRNLLAGGAPPGDSLDTDAKESFARLHEALEEWLKEIGATDVLAKLKEDRANR